MLVRAGKASTPMRGKRRKGGSGGKDLKMPGGYVERMRRRGPESHKEN